MRVSNASAVAARAEATATIARETSAALGEEAAASRAQGTGRVRRAVPVYSRPRRIATSAVSLAPKEQVAAITAASAVEAVTVAMNAKATSAASTKAVAVVMAVAMRLAQEIGHAQIAPLIASHLRTIALSVERLVHTEN